MCFSQFMKGLAGGIKSVLHGTFPQLVCSNSVQQGAAS